MLELHPIHAARSDSKDELKLKYLLMFAAVLIKVACLKLLTHEITPDIMFSAGKPSNINLYISEESWGIMQFINIFTFIEKYK